MKKTYSTAYLPYQIATTCIAIVLVTAVILLSRTSFPDTLIGDIVSTLAVIAAIWCLAEIALSLFTWLKIENSQIIFGKTIFSSRIEFNVKDIVSTYLIDKNGNKVSGKKVYRNVKLCFELKNERTESISFSAVTSKKIQKIITSISKVNENIK